MFDPEDSYGNINGDDITDWIENKTPGDNLRGKFNQKIPSETHSYIHIIEQTSKAWLICFDSSAPKKGNWFPKSKCQINKEERTITIPRWLILQKSM